jgi:type I restriction enzyme S subunit
MNPGAPTLIRFKPYSRYKDSGVEWLGEIPAHWEVKRLKHLAQIASGFAPPASFARSIGTYPVYGSNGLIGYCDEYFLAKDTIAVGRVGASGSVNVIPAYSWVSDNALLVRNIRATVRLPLLCYVLETMNLGLQATKNAQPIITGSFLGNQSLGTPPEPEQRAIADFLDRETTKIDALMEKKERLIELLKEKRTALISHAVTKGLDPTVPMKDSGIEWLGEIPAHWEVRRLRFSAELNPSITEVAGAGGNLQISFLPMEKIGEDGSLVLDDIRQEHAVSQGYTYFRNGDVLVAKITPCFENGKGALANDLENGIGFGSTELHVIRPKEGIIDKFLWYLTVSQPFRDRGQIEMKGTAGQKRIPKDYIRNFKAPIPPLHQQRAIADFLDRETTKIDALMEKVREAIERFKEYRTALISAAVTGKIDVLGEIPKTQGAVH